MLLKQFLKKGDTVKYKKLNNKGIIEERKSVIVKKNKKGILLENGDFLQVV